ncbi:MULTISPECIES: sulfite exporter TauE/SafE family protein [unclassified Mycolicibacterium]|uniref:sulfite exporter TauE/SafE family protein n=1 Tax=unclassified Mycolicibacterium TaxID=2636767 RepID=UPI0012DC56F8|nr:MULTISPECIES: sulfite exporter TauE/SafE family protein [unclassified Mycolicibacterium]MUL83637.1 sulfite exporter TauE/SafE family protein [Mycolicibacterium sp. CBMA 329]MUL90628.1 sulfite exporter TauE/SafE family protein [Mycolicibacterium sp. CBMA 331]MUM00598.1 sulfite exporter TauE/SafE family protein [Mycolicibacterium sp. CBMA 334]MUM25489.1 sulfite exporter TauE/SafE family protein [Mycolicibacterium sp. CBMA 295]MUM41572.1 sulfite exporter TauE/SafE family protein [Mycolicibacte
MIALAVALAVLVGVSLGLLGGGGSILTVPLLAYVAGMEAKQAIATSLVVVGVTSAVSTLSHARAGRVQWRSGLLFGAAGMAGAYLGGRLSYAIPGSVLLIAFTVVMIATAIAMIKKRPVCEPTTRAMPVGKALLMGLAVGLVTGTVGAGGGFLVVPALALLGGLPMPVAVGTSLLVITMNSAAGLAGHLSTVPIDWTLAGAVTAAAVLGSLLGTRLTVHIDPDALRRAFGWFVLLMASVILAQEVHPAVGLTAAGLTVLAGLGSLSCARLGWCPLRWIFGPRAATT